MQRTQVYLRRSVVRAIELLDSIYIVGGKWSVQTGPGRPPDGRTESGEYHVTTTNFFLRRANLGSGFLQNPRIENLGHFFHCLETACQCLVNELHGNDPFLNGKTVIGVRSAHTSAPVHNCDLRS